MLERRDVRTFKRLYEKLKHLKNCIFYTDNWDAFSAVFPAERHVIGKAHTYIIENNNSKYAASFRSFYTSYKSRFKIRTYGRHNHSNLGGSAYAFLV